MSSPGTTPSGSRGRAAAGVKTELACGAMRHVSNQRKAAIEHHPHAPADRLDTDDPTLERVSSARRGRNTRDDHVVGRNTHKGELLSGRSGRGDFEHPLTQFEVGELVVGRGDPSRGG